jgi:hypothetical protein
MRMSAIALGSTMFGLTILAAAAAPALAQNCGCVDAKSPPYCVLSDATCWVSPNFYNNHIADSARDAEKRMKAANQKNPQRTQSTYFVISNPTAAFKALKAFAATNQKSVWTTGASANTYACKMTTKTDASCTVVGGQYGVCANNNKVTHLMNTAKNCED